MTKGDLKAQGHNVRKHAPSTGEIVHSPSTVKSKKADDAFIDDTDPFDNDDRTGETQEPNRLVGFVVFVFVMAGFIYAAIHLIRWLEDEQQLPVQKVIFSGQRSVLVDSQMEALIRNKQKGSFFALDVNKVHQLLEDMPWVYRASVRKRWPSSLHIYLVEQAPVAIWNDDLLLNTQGDIFDGGDVNKKLPQLFGPGGSEKTALAGFKAMQSLLSSTGLTINELFLSERFAWRVELSNGIRLNIGRQQFIDRLQNFIDVFPLLEAQNKAINYIDLRYDIGLAVGWQKNSKKEQEIRQNND
ncbi:cell division protein FtsQ/DivIB [Brumicola pallidula]|uniref:Cell division protein FtsQ n=1 Tax=Brumicola pallidula DSM 14239 = ACAM 615 TaxID=1121922 RepID=K7A5Z1_9ALTE|nr:cell division protein FtsQ/DivIB [Glaciecola pallidula]GAC30875.1 cell division protein FtsQ [Glaciecola pallidula DSM 14239 = ACAM 615]